MLSRGRAIPIRSHIRRGPLKHFCKRSRRRILLGRRVVTAPRHASNLIFFPLYLLSSRVRANGARSLAPKGEHGKSIDCPARPSKTSNRCASRLSSLQDFTQAENGFVIISSE